MEHYSPLEVDVKRANGVYPPFMMYWRTLGRGCFLVALGASAASAQGALPSSPATTIVNLSAATGTPLRLYLTKRVRFKQDASVVAKFVAPVWTFDRISIPAGSTAEGHIVRLDSVPRFTRAMSIVRGDFTPLKVAQVQFNRIRLPDGRTIDITTTSSAGLGSIYVEPKPPKPKHGKTDKRTGPSRKSFARLKTIAKQKAESVANGRTRGLFALVHAPDRKEWIEQFLCSKIPYHPQWYPRGARFDALLEQPVDFGSVQVPRSEIGEAKAGPANEQTADLRLSETISSADASAGDPIHAVLEEPVFSADHHLILPEGTDFTGKVTLAKRARLFHRGGKLRFTFNQIKTPPELTDLIAANQRTHAQLDAVEQKSTKVAVDTEGTAKAMESKTRFLRPLVAGLVAAKSLDNDAGKVHANAGASANYSGRSLGGFSGFGLFGTLAVKAPKPVGSALGLYGLAWSAYSTVVSRGRDVVFEKDAAIEIRFSDR